MNRAERMTEMFRRGACPADIAIQFGVQSPAVYKALRRTGALPPYRIRPETKLGGGRVGRQAAGLGNEKRLEVQDRPRVSRDPCFLCGVRGDVGCKHQRRAAITILSPPQRQGMAPTQGA